MVDKEPQITQIAQMKKEPQITQIAQMKKEPQITQIACTDEKRTADYADYAD